MVNKNDQISQFLPKQNTNQMGKYAIRLHAF